MYTFEYCLVFFEWQAFFFTLIKKISVKMTNVKSSYIVPL